MPHRLQYVDIHGNISSTVAPQGSILGPLLYLIYVNDIGKFCQCNIFSFADETTLYVSHSNINELFLIANKRLENLFSWFCANKLALKERKTNYIVIRESHVRPNLAQLNITNNGIQLDRIGNDCNEQYCKFLGIHIDENLSWKYHINQVFKNVSRALFSIK